MQKKKIHRIVAVSTLTCCLLFGGCGRDASVPDTTATPSTATAEMTATESATEATRALTLSVVNMCGIEIGMVAVIDPATGEQVNLDSLSDQESISMEADWPSSVTEFQWALYNTDGELCIEGKTDISSARTSATLLLTGNGDLEKVEELFE